MTKDSAEPSASGQPSNRSLFSMIGPGILVAATGVGAGDLAGGAFAGAKLGPAILWIVITGAGLKYLLCEGLARWQLQTGVSIANGVFRGTPEFVRWGFLTYVAIWSVCIGGMLMSACGECAHAIIPIGDPATGRLIWGIIHSIAAILMVRAGGFRLFERVMMAFIGVMFVTVLCVTILSRPEWPEVFRGLVIPTIPQAQDSGIDWALTLMAGVGGTLTLLCYGSWIREKKRTDVSSLNACRVDLGAGYLMTAVFGICMVILGSRIPFDDSLKGVNLINSLSNDMQKSLGSAGTTAAWMFRIGAWGAVFSSLLGVWQSIPELVSEMLPKPMRKQDLPSRFLLAIGIVPMCLLPFSLVRIQVIAGITGAVFLPLLALALLILPLGRVGRESGFRHHLLVTAGLALCMVFFGFMAYRTILLKLSKLFAVFVFS